MSELDDAPRTYADRYVLGERLAAGPSSEVWHAHDDVVGRQVALKIGFGDRAADPGRRVAFERDAVRLAALSHPGLAKIHEYGSSPTETWLAMTFAGGSRLDQQVVDRPLTAAAALDAIGQTAMALEAAHGIGIAHGDVSAANLLVREDRVLTVVGFALGTGARRAGDLTALGALAEQLLGPAIVTTTDLPGEIPGFVAWVTGRGPQPAPTGAGDVARTALALAASLTAPSPEMHAGGAGTTLRAPGANAGPAAPLDQAESPAERAARQQVRNRLIALAAIVVIGGAFLLRLVTGGGGQVTVPREIGLPISQAQLNLTSAGLRSRERIEVGTTDSGGTVLSQSPQPGEQVKAGSTVTLIVSTGSR
jgi:PASTA domain/Protein kinase domain